MKKSEARENAAEHRMLASLNAEFNADPDAFIERTKALTSRDFQRIGRVIQLYCYADFAARRIIDCIDEALNGPQSRNAHSLRDHDVFTKLRSVALNLDNENHQEGLIGAADIFEMHREMRHNFAHWAVRRVKSKRALLLLSKNARQGGKRHGKTLDGYTSSYGLEGIRTLDREIRKLEDHVQNLALFASHFEKCQDELNERLG